MDRKELEQRTKKFGLRIITLAESLPKNVIGKIITNQIVKSGTSVGANYRSACRGRSKAEFVAKIGIVLEEADECIYWLEIIEESGMISKTKISSLYKEANEIAAIFNSIIRSSKIVIRKS